MRKSRTAGVLGGGAAIALFLLVACTGDKGEDSGPGLAKSGAPAASAPSLEPLHTLVPFVPEPPADSEAEVELGRVLFFDPRLSGDNTISCASCHAPEKGFADARATAAGKGGKALARNTPTLINLASRGPYFLDGRAASLEAQALMPVESPDEMAEDVEDLVGELAVIPEYAARFKRAFPGKGIQKETIAQAIAAFERSIVSAGSPYDKKLRREPGGMSAEASRGMGLFVGKGACVKCHDGPQLTDNSFHNIGVSGHDEGRFSVMPMAILKGAWKTPTLRDVELTAPYFHDGSEGTLEGVIDHYDRGGVAHGAAPLENLDPDIKPLGLSAEEKRALVAFLKALTGEGAPAHGVSAPRVPMVPAVTKASIRALMKDTDGMLVMVDKLFQSLNEGAWADVLGHVEALTRSAEQIDVVRGAKVDPARRAELRERAGDLIVALADVARGARAKRRADTTKAYGVVREACEACHTSFRSKGGVKR